MHENYKNLTIKSLFHITNKNVFLNIQLIWRRQFQNAFEGYKSLTPYNPKSFQHNIYKLILFMHIEGNKIKQAF